MYLFYTILFKKIAILNSSLTDIKLWSIFHNITCSRKGWGREKFRNIF